MKHEDLLHLIDRQEEINQQRAKLNYTEILDEEFVVDKSFLKYMDYLKQHKEIENRYWMFEELIKNDEIPTKKLKEFDISKQMNGQCMYLHKHTYIEVDYVYKGYCEYHIANCKQVIRLEEKGLCIVNQSIVHGIDTPDPSSIVIKCMIPLRYFDINDFEDLSREDPLYIFLNSSLHGIMTEAEYLMYKIHEPEYIEELIYYMFSEFLNQETGWRQKVKNLLSSFMIALMRIEPVVKYNVGGESKEKLNMPKVLEYIHDHYKDITLKTLAKDLHFHENYISRRIKETMKMSFQEYLLYVRMKEAKRLLSETDLSIKDIATQVGYKKPGFFYKVFKERNGITPSMYRERNGDQCV